ncbi:MAG: RNA-binding protein [Rickettsiales bacterium]|nr:RNA-binding protein [Rickettsiales bacterium]
MDRNININLLNLSRKTTIKELIKLFKTYGTVELCHIVTDKETGKSKGFGFIRMSNDDEAQDAIKNLHGTLFGGNKIKVKSPNKTK